MRRFALLAALAALIVWPALFVHPGDGFPISSYPMFAKRAGSVVRLATAVGLDADGHVHRLGPRALGGGDEVIQAAEQARLAVAEGDASTAAYCREVAGRVHDPEITTVVVRTEVRDAVADLHATKAPIAVIVHARCHPRAGA